MSEEERERRDAVRAQVDRRRRRRRVVAWCVAGAVVLGIAGWAAEPSVRDKVITARACDGAIPDGSMDVLRATTQEPDAHLTDHTTEIRPELGRYFCQVGSGRLRVLEVRAYTRRDDIDRELATEFGDDGGHPRAALPGGLPGFERSIAGITLMPPCPGRGKDAAGHPGRLLVEVLGGYPAPAHQLLRTGAAVANKAAERLGCGGKPLPVPASEAEPEQVRPAAAAGTSCAALADVRLPDPVWTAELRIPRGPAPMASCALRRPGKDENGEPRDAVVQLYGYYGDFSQRMVLRAARTDGVAGDRERTGPWLTRSGGWALARCDGQTAAFQVQGSPRGGAEGDEKTEDGRDLRDKRKLRDLLASFAKKESAARGCEDLRLPSVR
ncbi:hypothetical protein G3260_004306 [Streptomyces albus]|uniref:hypothetical protein n=1 Tax=Streptomyces TaxID=1883 RepID=UPI0004CCE4BE|nr:MULTISPECIES: hypothetical protein [Streptomyces]QID37794.1 hypothetical protein G3260_004306 [Streptomyces albus]